MRYFIVIFTLFLASLLLGMVGIAGSVKYRASQLEPVEKVEAKYVPTHIPTPNPVRAIYMSGWVAGTSDFKNKLIKVADETEVNAIVVDIKDYTGNIIFDVSDPALLKYGSVKKRIPDINAFIKDLHDHNIYIIGRIAVFQDQYMAGARPDLAVKRASTGAVWRDYKGIKWIDTGSHEMWDYVIALAKESYRLGFDEINFDYIRFPADGNTADTAYPFYNPKEKSKAEQVKEFWAYLHDHIKPLGIPMSADIFGLTTTAKDDLNIGQVLENAALYFDYLSPMVYPSHYPDGFNGYKNPADHPYEIVKFAMDGGVAKLRAASSSPSKLRPWLQDFDLGAKYTPEMVRAQIQAVYDDGLTSWMMWDPANTYTVSALYR